MCIVPLLCAYLSTPGTFVFSLFCLQSGLLGKLPDKAYEPHLPRFEIGFLIGDLPAKGYEPHPPRYEISFLLGDLPAKAYELHLPRFEITFLVGELPAKAYGGGGGADLINKLSEEQTIYVFVSATFLLSYVCAFVFLVQMICLRASPVETLISCPAMLETFGDKNADKPTSKTTPSSKGCRKRALPEEGNLKMNYCVETLVSSFLFVLMVAFSLCTRALGKVWQN